MIKNKGPIYVLDIGNYALKLIKLDLHRQRPCVLVTRSVKLPHDKPTPFSYENIKDELAHGIERLFSQEPKNARKNVAVLLANNSLFTRFVTLPNISRSKLNQIINFEVEQQIPFIIDEVTWAYTVIPLPQTHDLSVLIAAIRNTDIDALTEILSAHNISIHAFGINHLAYVNLLHYFREKDKNVLVIDLGDESTNLIFLEGNKTWGRHLFIGGEKLNSML